MGVEARALGCPRRPDLRCADAPDCAALEQPVLPAALCAERRRPLAPERERQAAGKASREYGPPMAVGAVGLGQGPIGGQRRKWPAKAARRPSIGGLRLAGWAAGPVLDVFGGGARAAGAPRHFPPFAMARDCNFCHFPHGEEKFAQMEALSTKARGSDRNQAGGRRPRTVAGPRGGGSGQRLALCDHLDLVGSWAGCQPRAGGVACGGGKLAEAGALGHALGPDRGAAWQALGAEQLKAILLSAQPEHYDD
ncbi:unnamed protein product [Prorocentrum cordatum]|uniref:Uncharacterized protein n=1 Tax=Prorocentrum cordatum TaxID=2364126 RepID=A0ABN9U6M1_9DINO|nr:unnamed protein product [Polarella glacialis]